MSVCHWCGLSLATPLLPEEASAIPLPIRISMGSASLDTHLADRGLISVSSRNRMTNASSLALQSNDLTNHIPKRSEITRAEFNIGPGTSGNGKPEVEFSPSGKGQ